MKQESSESSESRKNKWANLIDKTKEASLDLSEHTFPKMTPIHNEFKDAPFKVGSYQLLPKGTCVWCVDAQSLISFEDDQIIEVTNTTCYGDPFFGKLKQLLFNIPGHIPTLIDKGKIEISTSFSKTSEYIVPKPQF